ncbi:EcoAI/FtnUII family type I restriction enzme subunit R [Arthrospira platensis]|nr:type I restriction endonuclease subunit R [Arthrospira platensis]AMW28956.1 restriction endonuclease subunit R [Arthrospira platensis YZ]MBD2668453.1 DEAD/DEAH box helicase family protein [Arthrospira platensis FACHB-439]MBD2711654.1 DEAD/DEAH box helicase family protein [Arthrospira platensis FACHB-835]MDT9183679.1 DEAD/DEAH box helicase family protein [Limnospira sp. PMC 289.06]QQW31721.1 DEAD/DEAH box helicase family protein [Arthrospira sp. PCC 9108]
MNEAETRAELIDPALKATGWGVVLESRIGREVIAPGRLLGGGKRAKPEYADYVLVYRNQKLAVIEAKKRDLRDTEGVGQAKKYAEKLQIRFAYSTNSLGIYQIDMLTGAERHISEYPTPDELWDATFSEANEWRNRFAVIPFEDKSGSWEARYYQHNAITQVLEAIAAGQARILLTMATGTGKTFIAFQLAWKLFQSRWNLSRQPTRRPRVLFLADRNILANQAFNSFSAFPDDALIRIDPESIRKQGRVPKNGSIFFTIFQTFMSGKDAEGNPTPNFGDYPSDFFDFIIIDECHRGGANDEGSWRGILEYFAPAVQLGLTATPKRTNNADTYAYFGEPVYTYALKDGINDGFLTPFRLKQIETTLDKYIYTSDDTVIEGEAEEGRLYTEKDFNRIIEIEERERYRVKLLMESLDQNEKTIVFCANQDHALAIRDLINQMKISNHPNYCVRVTANDGEIGNKHLKTFQDNEKRIPTILTSSQKLSTGVDARNVRNIVLLRPINSMIEFKQIIGRGTRLFEGKDYFTIYDFVGAYQHFNDPEWDGEPEEPTPITPREKRPDSENRLESEPTEPQEPAQPKKLKIQLADGKDREIEHTLSTSFWSADGKPLTAAQFIERLFGDLPELFQNENELRELWSLPETRNQLLEGLAEKGYGPQELNDISRLIHAEKSDIYDVLAYIAYASTPITRKERVMARKRRILSHYNDKQQEFLNFVLDHYMNEGVNELNPDKLPQLIELKYRSMADAVAQLGKVPLIRQVFIGFQRYLYDDINTG